MEHGEDVKTKYPHGDYNWTTSEWEPKYEEDKKKPMVSEKLTQMTNK